MRHTLLLALPALQEVLAEDFRQIKYSLFPPLSLLTLAGMTLEENYRIVVRDEHVEPVEVNEEVDLVAMTVYVSSAHRAYDLADLYRRRGAKVVFGGIHPTTMPEEASEHADAICIGPAEPIWQDVLHDFEQGRLQKVYRGLCPGSASLTPLPRRANVHATEGSGPNPAHGLAALRHAPRRVPPDAHDAGAAGEGIPVGV